MIDVLEIKFWNVDEFKVIKALNNILRKFESHINLKNINVSGELKLHIKYPKRVKIILVF